MPSYDYKSEFKYAPENLALFEFLRRQDFTKGVYEILNIDNFLLYCCTYDRAARVSDGTVVVPVKKN